jgi:hypothetical protein
MYEEISYPLFFGNSYRYQKVVSSLSTRYSIMYYYLTTLYIIRKLQNKFTLKNKVAESDIASTITNEHGRI